MAETRGALTRLAGPEPLVAGLGGTRREPLGSLDMGYHEAGERHGAGVEQVEQPAEAGIEPIDKPMQPDVLIAQRPSEPGKARGRARPEDLLLEPAYEAPEDGRVEPAGGQWVLERGEQWHRGEPARGEFEHQTQKGAGRRAVQWQAGRIVDLDPPASQLDGNPAGEFAVGGDERRGRPRRLELAAQQERDRHRLLLRARAIEAADPVEGVGRLRRQAEPRVAGCRRPQRFADQPHPPRPRPLTCRALRGTLSRIAREGNK